MACEYQCYKEELNESIPPLCCNIDNIKCLFSKMCIEDQILKMEFLDKNYSKDYIYIIKDGDVTILSETPPIRAKRYAKKE